MNETVSDLIEGLVAVKKKRKFRRVVKAAKYSSCVFEKCRDGFLECIDYQDYVFLLKNMAADSKATKMLAQRLFVEKCSANDFLNRILNNLQRYSGDACLEKKNFYSPVVYMSASSDWMDLIRKTEGKDPGDNDLSDFYNKNLLVGHSFARIFNDNWMASRFLPFLSIPEALFSGTYVEDGGGDGLLALFASSIFNKSYNVELCDRQRSFADT